MIHLLHANYIDLTITREDIIILQVQDVDTNVYEIAVRACVRAYM